MNPFKPFTVPQAVAQLDRYFQKFQAKGHPSPLQVRVFSHRSGMDYSYPPDSTNQPYHIASIGKVFTAVLVQMLAEKASLSLKDPLLRFFSPAELEGLFVYRGIDYARQVTVEHLLGHTSGIADYFEGKTLQGSSFTQEILSNPTYHWTPQKLVEFTRQNQKAVGIPGQKFNYSDTGYILLGLLIEKVSGQSFARNLREKIFSPLAMNDSYLMFYDEQPGARRNPIQKIWFNGSEISTFESLSCDWSGGGIISTTEDLLKFSLALRSGQLLQKPTLESMEVCAHKFRPGIYYGLGMMEIHFKDFFFLLGNLPKAKGHIGILATHMFYDPLKDAHILLNFGSNTRMVDSFQALIQVESILQRVL